MNTLRPAKVDLYGKFAFAVIVLVVFSEFLQTNRVTSTPARIVLVFALGALHAGFGILCADGPGRLTRPVRLGLYFAIQCGLVSALLLLTPLKGFSFLIAMPITSMAVLELRWPYAAAVATGLYVVCVTAIWLDLGADSALRAVPSYGIAFVFTVLFSFVTRRAQEARLHAEALSTELAAANEQLRLHAAQAGELATTRERNRIAREIHDGLGHYLTTINVQVEAARAVFAANPGQAAAALEKASKLSREALDDVRRSVGTLRTDTVLPPLPEALRSLAENLGLHATIHVAGSMRPLPSAAEHALYRAAQEGLTNVRKHAATLEAELFLDFSSGECVRLTITDHGRGAVDGTPPAAHGLRGLRERIDLLGGQVATSTPPGGGFRLDVTLPA